MKFFLKEKSHENTILSVITWFKFNFTVQLSKQTKHSYRNSNRKKNEQKTVVAVKNEKNLQVARTVAALNCFAAKEDGRLE